MRRLLLAILLLALLVAVGYFQILRRHDREAEVRREAVGSQRAEMDSARTAADSLAAVLKTTESKLADTVAANSARLASTSDSLQSVIADKDSAIAELRQANDSLQSKVSTSSSQSSSGKAAHKDILRYYKTEVDKLPGDLSSYERRVALGEVRKRTAQKFAITVKRLNEIRERYNLDY